MATSTEIEEKIKKEAIFITRGSLVETIEKEKFLHGLNNSLGIVFIDKGMGYCAFRVLNYKHKNGKVSEILNFESILPHYGLFSENKIEKKFESIKEEFENVEKEQREKNEALVRIGEFENLVKEKDGLIFQTLSQLNARPNITIEDYIHLLNNQKPIDYDSIKSELNKWKDGLGGKTLEQVQTELNKISELEKRLTPEQLSELTKENLQQSPFFKTIINKLPSLVNEKGEIDEKSLALLTSISGEIAKLENGEEEGITISVGENSSYEVINSSEKKRLENELAEKERKNNELRKELDSLKAAEEERKNQLQQANERERQARDKIKAELALINGSIASPEKLTAEKLTDLQKKFQEAKISLNGIAGEQTSKKTINDDEREEMKEVLKQTKLNLKRYRIKQVIADALADKGAEKPVIVKEEELEERYKNYSETLDKINDSNELDNFKEEILQAIAEKRGQYWLQYRIMNNALSKGKKAIANNDFNKAKKAETILLTFHKSNHVVFLKFNKAGEAHVLMAQIESLKTTAQIEQVTR